MIPMNSPTQLEQTLINYPITDFSLQCVRFVYRAEKSNKKIEIDLSLELNLFTVSVALKLL